MSSTIRHDFSFPPKSNSMNNNNRNQMTRLNNINVNSQNHSSYPQNGDISLTRSTSTSMLTNNCNNNNSTSYCTSCKCNNSKTNGNQINRKHDNAATQMKTPMLAGVHQSGHNMLAHAMFHGATKKGNLLTLRNLRNNFMFFSFKMPHQRMQIVHLVII